MPPRGSAAGPAPGARHRPAFLIAVATVLLLFLLEQDQNRDTAVQIKLDEILASLRDADERKVGVEELSTPELREIQEREREKLRAG